MEHARVEALVRELLVEIGEDPDREGLARTPARIAEALRYLTSGYQTDVEQLVHGAIFAQEANNMVIARDIEIYSLCEHHMLPFFGRCHVGYIPQGRVFGISKLARIADAYCRRLQIQERLTEQIARTIMDTIEPYGVGVVIDARHLCMMMRGVEKQSSRMVTSSVFGSFRESHATRSEFLELVKLDHV